MKKSPETYFVTWEEFKSCVKELPTESSDEGDPIEWIFRGQADSKWDLQSTLERHFIENDRKYHPVFQSKYVNFLCKKIKKINDISQKEFKFFDEKNINPSNIQMQSFMDLTIWLRHNEFPSPILDWTRNWNVAAFFALNNTNKSSDASIYAYAGLDETRSGWTGDSNLIVWSPDHRHSVRHQRQEACYLLCTQDYHTEKQAFPSYMLGLENDVKNHRLIEFVLSRSEKAKVLAELEHSGYSKNWLLPADNEHLAKDLAAELDFDDLTRFE